MPSLRALSGGAQVIGSLALLLAPALALAGPEARVRVRGGTRIEATAAATGEGFMLKGNLREDAGRPVPAARLRVRLVGPNGVPRALHRAEACGPGERPSNEPTRGTEEEVVVRTDASGHFCLRWSLDFPNGRLTLSFDDERGLLDPAEQSVEIEQALPVELDFARAPRTLSLDANETMLELVSRAREGAATEPLPLTLLWTRAGAPTTTLLRRTLRPGESAQLRFASRELGGPGPGELRARLGSNGRAAEAHIQVLATATAHLRAPGELSLSASGEGSLIVAVHSSVAAVSSGSVEALIHSRTVGIATVAAGQAQIALSLGAGPFSAPITVRYLPSSPWWLAGSPALVSVSVPKASAWRAMFWAATLLAIAAYIAAAWRRPPRPSSKRQEPDVVSPPKEATMRWVPPAPGVQGWTGMATDAHDGSPIAGALVVATLPGDVEHRTVTEPDGSFRLAPPPNPAHAAGRMRVEGRWHSALDGELPPQGHIVITLVTRRRTLLARLVSWTRKRGAPWAGSHDPTPGDVARSAETLAERKVATWARAVEIAAFGPAAVDPAEEARVRSLEPDSEP